VRLAFWVTLAVLVIPLVITGVRAMSDGWTNPGGDLALIELRVRDVGAHTPLLGSYGRYGFSQPGALWFYLLAIPYRLLGSSYAALQVGVLLVDVAAIAVMLVVARRRGGTVHLLIVGALLAVLVHGLGPQWLADPWEPHALTLLCAALLFLAYDAILGGRAALVGAAVVATLLAEAQAGLVVFAVLVLLWTVAAVVIRAVRAGGSPEGRAQRRSAAIASIVAAVAVMVLAVPPLLALAGDDTGNLADLVRSMRHPTAPTLGIGDGWRVVALELGPNAPWLRSHQPLDAFSPTVDLTGAWITPFALVALVALGVALVVGARRRVPASLLAATVAIGIVGAVASLARLLGPLFFWIPEWTRVLGFACWVAVAWCVYEVAGHGRRRAIDRVAIPLLGVVLAIATVANVADAVRTDPPATPSVDAVHRLADAVAPDVQDGTTLITAGTDPSQVLGSDPGQASLVLALERAGADVVVDADLADHYGEHRAQPGRAVRELRLLTDREAVPPGYEVVATADPLTPEQRAERDRIVREHPELSTDIPGADRIRFILDHPELRPVADALNAIPDLPVLTLVQRSLP